MEGNGDTDPDFLDDPSGNIPGSVRLDNREQLVRESIRESFSWWRPRSLPRFSGPAINDLVAHRWHGKLLTPEQEVAITCRVQAREGMAFDKLLAGFQRNILKVANGHMPRYWRPRRLHAQLVAGRLRANLASKDFALTPVVIMPVAKITPVQRLKILLWAMTAQDPRSPYFFLTKTMSCNG